MYILVRFYLLRSYFIALRLLGAHARGGRSELSLWSLAENLKAKAHALLTSKLTYFHGFLAFTDWEYTCEM